MCLRFKPSTLQSGGRTVRDVTTHGRYSNFQATQDPQAWPAADAVTGACGSIRHKACPRDDDHVASGQSRIPDTPAPFSLDSDTALSLCGNGRI